MICTAISKKQRSEPSAWCIEFETTDERLTSDDVARWTAELGRLPLGRSGDKRRLELARKIGAAEHLIADLRRNMVCQSPERLAEGGTPPQQ